jgi:hypothetical protein
MTQQGGDYQPKRKQLNPVLRGVGCISVLTLTVGVYALCAWFLHENQTKHLLPFQVPDLTTPLPAIPLPNLAPGDGSTQAPGKVNFELGSISWIAVGIAAVLDIIIYGITFVIYSAMNPIKLGPKDAPPLYPRKGRSKNLVR